MKVYNKLNLFSKAVVPICFVFSACKFTGNIGSPNNDENSIVAALGGLSPEDLKNDNLVYKLKCKSKDGKDVRVEANGKKDAENVRFPNGNQNIKEGDICSLEITTNDDKSTKDFEWFGYKTNNGKEEKVVGLMYASESGSVANRSLKLVLYKLYSANGSSPTSPTGSTASTGSDVNVQTSGGGTCTKFVNGICETSVFSATTSPAIDAAKKPTWFVVISTKDRSKQFIVGGKNNFTSDQSEKVDIKLPNGTIAKNYKYFDYETFKALVSKDNSSGDQDPWAIYDISVKNPSKCKDLYNTIAKMSVAQIDDQKSPLKDCALSHDDAKSALSVFTSSQPPVLNFFGQRLD